MLKVINNIKQNFNINKILIVLMFLITSLFTINYITLNSNFSFQANIQTEESDDILEYLTKMSNNPIIKQNKELLDQCTNLLNEYNQIKKDIKNFFIEEFKDVNDQLFNPIETRKNEIEGQLNTITDLMKNKEDQKQTFETLKQKINEYLDNALEKLKNIVTFFQNIDNQDTITTIESLKDNLTKFKEIYDYLKDDNNENYKNINDKLLDLYNNNQKESETELRTSIEDTRTKISSINSMLKTAIISEQILDKDINNQNITLSVLINPNLDEKLNNFKKLKDKIDTILNTDTNTNIPKNNNDEDNFEFSSNNSSFAGKLFYLLCILITVTFLLIIYQFNKKNEHKNKSL